MKDTEPTEYYHVVRGKDGRFIFQDNAAQRNRTAKTAEELNGQSDLPLKFLCRFGKELKKKLETECPKIVPNYMSRDYYFDDFEAVFSGYPHDEGSPYLTGLTVKSKKYAVYGIKIGDDPEESREILRGRGYLPAAEEDGPDDTFKKDDVLITLFADRRAPKKISGIQVSVITFYLGNRLY